MASEKRQEAFKRILFCTDMSRNAEFAFNYALSALRPEHGAELHLLHVIPETEAQFWKTYVYELEGVDEKAKRDLDQEIKSSYLSRVPEGLALKVEYRIGKDWREILAYASEREIDLIVIGREASSEARRALFGSIVELVARKAECAVLILPKSLESRA